MCTYRRTIAPFDGAAVGFERRGLPLEVTPTAALELTTDRGGNRL
ncbi:hypothetical protein [Natrialbaceae archaeon AArc-T1-2]|nr:hypothetical protein [Natrialbaceae archaeon AArc-T1-2]WIV65762.1 hypothetical protein QQ977_08585 [Natrialbaceae archaeon AArc-T1-2]